MHSTNTSAFLGEDLGLDIYKNIDEWLYDLELKQYEYELTWQGESDVSEVVWGILEKEGIECNLDTIQDIEEVVSWQNPIWIVQLKCNDNGDTLSSEFVAKVSQKLWDVKSTFSQRAENKSKQIYEIAKIGLYSDGNEENSPFDLIFDLQEIDRVIFSEEIEYNGEEFQVDDKSLLDFLEEDKSYLYDDEEDENEEGQNENEETAEEVSPETDQEETITPPLLLGSNEHAYACLPSDASGLNLDSLQDLDLGVHNDIPRRWGRDIPIIEDEYYVYTDGEYGNGTSWWGPFRWAWPTGWYEGVSDPWKCDEFFCIIIEFVMKNQNLLGGGNTVSIESILAKSAEHFEKFANTSLVQSKMTTNNFELWLIIPNLWDMLRGFWIQVQTKPAPILNIEASDEKKNAVEWDRFTGKNMLTQYYKNVGLDYERRNDLDIIRQKTYERKVLEESTWLPTYHPPEKLAELNNFTESLKEKNEILNLAVDKKVLQDDTGAFYKQFVELERFVGSLTDFTASLWGIIKKMEKIPTRSS